MEYDKLLGPEGLLKDGAMYPDAKHFTVVSDSRRNVRPCKRHTLYMDYVKTLFCIIIFISLVGTSILLLIIIAHRRRTKLPLTTTMALGVLLSIDLLFLLTRLYSTVTDLACVGERTFTVELQRLIYSTLYDTSLVLQGYIQCVVSIERVIAIVRPLKVKTIVTRNRMLVALVFVILIICVWKLSLAVLAGIHIQNTQNATTQYFETLSNLQTSKRRHTLRTLFELIFAMKIRTLLIVDVLLIHISIPLLVLLICSVWIIVSLCRSRTSIANDSWRLKAQERRLGVVLVMIDIIFIISTGSVIASFDSDKTLVHQYLMLYSNEYLVGLGALTDWLVLLFLGRQVRAAVFSTISACACVRRRNRSQSTRTVTRNARSTTSTERQLREVRR